MTRTTVRAGQVRDGDLTSADFNSDYIDGASGTASLRTLGTGAQQAAAGNHSHTGLGSVLQCVYATKTNTASNLTTGEQETGLQIVITPTSATSKILVFGLANIAGNGQGYLVLKDSSTYLTRGDSAGSRTRSLVWLTAASATGYLHPTHFAGAYVPGVTTERTIKLHWVKISGDDLYLNRTRGDIDDAAYPRTASMIWALEIP